jgi:hypothetical protein
MQVTDKHTDEMTASDLEAVVNAGDYDTSDEGSDDGDYSRDRPLINEGAFEAIKQSEKPSTAQNPLLRAGILSAVAMGLLIPLGLIFKGNMSIKAGTVASETALDENGEPVEPFSPEADELAQLQLENSELKRTMGLASQSLSQSELDELAKKNGETSAKPGEPASGSQTPAQSSASSPVASRPAAAPVQSINYRPAPEPPRTTYRSPVATTSVTQRPAAAPVSLQPAKVEIASSAPTETVDPFEMRDRLSRLGNYGQSVAAGAPSAVAIASKNIVTPISQSASEPRTQNVAYRPAARVTTDKFESPVEPDNEQYYEDTAAVLGLPVADVAPLQGSETAMPILPGEMFKAKIINGVSWSQGERPEMALETIEDFAAESGAVLIPKGTRIIATVNGADESGSVFTGVSQIYMDSPLNIPADALVIQAEDGSVLRAELSTEGGANGGGLDIGGVLWGSAINAADNVIESDDSLVGDLAGGVGEAVLQDQRERVDAREEQRTVVTTPQVGVWTLTPRNVQIFVPRLISMEHEQDAEN